MIGYFISECGAKSVYDPCAGLCSFAILPELNEVDFVCSELNPRTKVIADIRLNAAGKHLEINQEDSTFNWRGNSNCDCLASELPFGLRLNDRSLDERRSLLLEDFVLDKFIESESLTSAVLLVSASTCVRGNNFRCRKCFVSFFTCNRLIFNMLCFCEMLRGTNWGQKFAIQKIKRANIKVYPLMFFRPIFLSLGKKNNLVLII